VRARLVVVADRIGERRPGELETADEDVDRLRELDRQRIEARLGESERAGDDQPVGEVEQVEADLGGHRRRPKRRQAAQQRGLDPQGEAAALLEDHHDDEDRADQVRAEQQAACPVPHPDDEHDGQGDRRQDVGDRGEEVGAGALVEAIERQQVFEHRRHPEAAIAILVSSVSVCSAAGLWGSSSASASGPAKGNAISAPIVENRRGRRRWPRRSAPGPRPPGSRSAAPPRAAPAGRRCWR